MGWNKISQTCRQKLYNLNNNNKKQNKANENFVQYQN
jgi:hypothetical protein